MQHLKPEDEAAVMVYAASTELLQGFTTDREAIVRAIRRAAKMESAEAAFFNEAIFQAARLTRRATLPASRRVIIWLTDNIPNAPTEEVRLRYARSLGRNGVVHSEQEAFDELFKSGAVVCTLLERSVISEDEFMRHLNDVSWKLESHAYPPGDVYRYTGQTGGEVLEAGGRKQVARKMAELIDALRTRYALGYHPQGSQLRGTFHPIRLEISPETEKRTGKLEVKTRKGYFR